MSGASYSQETRGPWSLSSQLHELPSTPSTQLQVAFSAHSGSQLHAGPPGARSSQ